MPNEESFVTKNKEMDCCSTIDVDETTPPVLAQVVTNGAMTKPESCVRCKAKGRAVSRKTVLLMLKPDLLEHATSGSYSFALSLTVPSSISTKLEIGISRLRTCVSGSGPKPRVIQARSVIVSDLMRVTFERRSRNQAAPAFRSESPNSLGKACAPAIRATPRVFVVWVK